MDLSLDEAGGWPDLLEVVRERVKPDRDRQRDNTIGNWLRKHWWRFWADRPDLYAALRPLTRCLVTSAVTKHLVFSFQPTDRIFSHKLYVFPLERYTGFAVLQSRVHVLWAWLLSSTMKTDLNYSASDCFETFPFPLSDPRAAIPAVEAVGEELYECRARLMLDLNQGLTKTYNALTDPACVQGRVLHLRELHERLDRVVLDAYGWTDVAIPPFCPSNTEERAALQFFEDEVIDRLFVLNSQRAKEQVVSLEPAARTRRKKVVVLGGDSAATNRAQRLLPGLDTDDV